MYSQGPSLGLRGRCNAMTHSTGWEEGGEHRKGADAPDLWTQPGLFAEWSPSYLWIWVNDFLQMASLQTIPPSLVSLAFYRGRDIKDENNKPSTPGHGPLPSQGGLPALCRSNLIYLQANKTFSTKQHGRPALQANLSPHTWILGWPGREHALHRVTNRPPTNPSPTVKCEAAPRRLQVQRRPGWAQRPGTSRPALQSWPCPLRGGLGKRLPLSERLCPPAPSQNCRERPLGPWFSKWGPWAASPGTERRSPPHPGLVQPNLGGRGPQTLQQAVQGGQGQPATGLGRPAPARWGETEAGGVAKLGPRPLGPLGPPAASGPGSLPLGLGVTCTPGDGALPGPMPPLQAAVLRLGPGQGHSLGLR